MTEQFGVVITKLKVKLGNKEIAKILEKKRIELARRTQPRKINPILILSVLFVLGFIIFLLAPMFTGLTIFETRTITNFTEGTFFNTTWNFSGNFLQLNWTNVNTNATVTENGTYLSKIFDAGKVTGWINISWIEGMPYQEEMPSNQRDELSNNIYNGINMSGNILLLHLNKDSTFTENDTYIYDFSGNNNNASDIINGTFVSGKLKNGINLNASTRNYVLGSTSPFDFADQNFTMSFWINKSSSTQGVIISEGGAGGGGWLLQSLSTNNLQMVLKKGGSDAFRATQSSGITNNEWHHIVALGFLNTTNETGNFIDFYVDGIRIKKDADSKITDYDPATVVYSLGSRGAGNSLFFNGTIDEVAVWNRTLSDNEVLELYKRGINHLNISVRSCDDSACSGETFGTKFGTTPQNLSVNPNRYFQYQVNMRTENNSFSPELYNVSIVTNTAPTHTAPYLNATTSLNSTNDNLTVYNKSTSDPDNSGNVKNIISWYLNGVPLMSLNMPFEGGSLNGSASGVSSGTTDYSGNANHGTVVNTKWCPTCGYDGRGAYEFNGTDDYIQIADSNSLDITEKLTMSAWVKIGQGSNIGNGDFIGGKWSSGADDQAYTFGFDPGCDGGNHRLGFILDNKTASQDWFRLCSNQTFSEEIWYHIAVTWNGTVARIYVNGSLSNETKITGTLRSTTKQVTIGRLRPEDNTYPFNGTIDEVTIWNRSLSQEQIASIYQNRTDLIVSQETETNQNWSASITPNDGTEDGDTLFSNNLTILGNQLPITSTAFTNESVISHNEFINFTVLITTGTNPLSTFIFSIDNGTGIFTNDSAVALGTSPQNISVIKQIPFISTTQVQWLFYANDSSNNWNTTGIQTFNVSLIASPSGAGCGYVNNDLIIAQRIITKNTCYTINASNLILNGQGFNITGNQTGYGINITKFQNITIKRFELNNFSTGIYINDTQNISLEQFNINEPLLNYGIQIAETSGVNLSNSNLTTTSNNIPTIILSTRTNNTLIQNNWITTRGTLSHGIILSNNIRTTNITHNNFTLFGSSVSAVNTSASTDTSNIIITFNKFLQNIANWEAVHLLNGTNSNISFNNFTTYASNGIRVLNGNNYFITNNLINTTSGLGARIGGTGTFSSNTIGLTSGSGKHGLSIATTNGVIYQNTIITDNQNSVITLLGDSNNVSNNNLTHRGTDGGIELNSGANYNIINSNNILLTNTTGTLTEGGISIVNTGSTDNNFTNNVVTVPLTSNTYSLFVGISTVDTELAGNTFSNNFTLHLFIDRKRTNLYNITIINGTTEIFFINVTIFNGTTIDTRGNITEFNNSVFINLTTLLPFNTSANITFNGVSYNSLNDYAILRDNDPCPSTICTKLNFNPVRFQVTGFSTYNTTLEKYPEWSSPSVNKTSITQNDWINIGTHWTDNLGLDSYIFSIDNGTGTFENHSAVGFTGLSNDSNVSIKTTYSGIVQWRFFANDSSNNINATDIQSFSVTALTSESKEDNAPTVGSSRGSGASSADVASEGEIISSLQTYEGLPTIIDINNGVIDSLRIITESDEIVSVAAAIVDKPDYIIKASDLVYEYIEIEAGGELDNNLVSASISFYVDKNWLLENSIDNTEIGLFRYTEDKWTELDTNFVKEDSSKIYYEANTPGFSLFAIGKRELVTDEKYSTEEIILVNDQLSPTPNLETENNNSVIYYSIIIILIFSILMTALLRLIPGKHYRELRMKTKELKIIFNHPNAFRNTNMNNEGNKK